MKKQHGHTIVAHDTKVLNQGVLERIRKNVRMLYRMRQCPICAGKLTVARCGLGERIISDEGIPLYRAMNKARARSSDEMFLCVKCNVLWRLTFQIHMQHTMPGQKTQPGMSIVELVGVNNCYCRRSVWKTRSVLGHGLRGLEIHRNVHQIHKEFEKPRGGLIPDGIRLKGAVIGR